MSDDFIFLINPLKDDLDVFIAATTFRVVLPHDLFSYLLIQKKKIEMRKDEPIKIIEMLPTCVGKRYKYLYPFICVCMCV